MATNKEIKEMFDQFKSSTNERMDDLFGQQVDHHLTLRDMTHLLEKIDMRIVDKDVAIKLDAKIEKLERKIQEYEKLIQIKPTGSKNGIDDLLNRTFMMKINEITAKYDAKIQQLENKIQQYENIHRIEGCGAKHDHGNCGSEANITQNKLKLFEAKFDQQQVNHHRLQSRLSEIETKLANAQTKYDFKFREIQSKTELDNAQIESIRSLYLEVNKKETVFKKALEDLALRDDNLKIKVLNLGEKEDSLRSKILKLEVDLSDVERKLLTTSSIDVKAELLAVYEKIKDLERKIKKMKHQNEKSGSSNSDFDISRNSSKNLFENPFLTLENTRKPSSNFGNSSSVFSSDFDNMPSLFGPAVKPFPSSSRSSSSNDGPWICRNCGRACGARIGLYSHEKSCFKKSGRLFDG